MYTPTYIYIHIFIGFQAMLESERTTMAEQDKMRKQQMLLGPASSGAFAPTQNAPLPPNP